MWIDESYFQHTAIRTHDGAAAAEQTAIDHIQRNRALVIQYDKTSVLIFTAWVEKSSRVVH